MMTPVPASPTATLRGGLREVLRSRQEARNRKSCEPCRERKVRCDRGYPCATCSRRGYPDLCAYREYRPRRHSTERELETAQLPPADGLSSVPSPHVQLVTDTNSHHLGFTGNESLADPHLPQATSLATVTQESSLYLTDRLDDRSAFETGVLPLLGMNEEHISTDLPIAPFGGFLNDFLSVEQDVYALFQSYKSRVHPFNTIPIDLDQLEKRLCAIIELRHNPGAEVGLEVDRVPRWLCLLHAVLASGAQFSEFPLKRRSFLSREHTKLSFELLRRADYLAQPSKEAIQTLLLLGNILQDEIKPQAAWALVGTTIRLAQSLSVHIRQSRSTLSTVTPEDAMLLRLAIVRQEALLSMALGHYPSCSDMSFEEDLPILIPGSDGEGLTYRQAMSWLCHLGIKHLESRKSTTPPAPLLTLNKIDRIDLSVSPHLKTRRLCSSTQDVEECYAFTIHKNFVISVICRSLLSDGSSAGISDVDSRRVLERLQTSLKRSSWAYISIRTISPLARRSWAFIHNGLTSVLLLSLMKETRHSEETRLLQDKLITSLQLEKKDYCLDSGSAGASLLSGSLNKALGALETMRILAEQETASQTPWEELLNTQTQGSSIRADEARFPVEPDSFTGQLELWNMAEWLVSFDSGVTSLGV
ncbi:c6 zinc finger domain-containing protein [Daldinia grandis]|nr:c6 zinc finger domain-containing protein [Daldinia grandis]